MDDRYSNTQLKLVTEIVPYKSETQTWKQIRRDRLVNSLNRINFQDGEVVLNFRHAKFDSILSVPARPQPCLDNYLECAWLEPFLPEHNFNNYIFENLYFTDGLKQVLVSAELLSIHNSGVNFSLPENALVVNSRKVRRHKCTDVFVQLFQSGIIFEGQLIAYSPVSFSVNIPNNISYNARQEIRRDEQLDIVLIKDNNILFSGRCEIFRLTESAEGRTVVLNHLNTKVQRFKSKKFRSVRQTIKPSPNIIFVHPFTGKRVNLRTNDISGSGFSVEESFENSLLIPGMVVPELTIELMSGLELQCKSQVMYRTSQDGNTVKCGFAFIDMSIKDQIRLTSYLHQASNKNAHVCTKINIDELWDFFFETGFVYPKKYFFIHANRGKFVEVYKKLYEQENDIAINFVYQDKGKIYGHMSMFRFYDKTWIIHHHAADSSRRSKAGLVVLEQIGMYINEFHRLPSTRMDYVGCYFRPDNKFPNLVFGGAARNSSDGCTVDAFAYMHLNRKVLNGELPGNMTLHPASKSDLAELKHFYETVHGGLTLKALDLDPVQINCDKNINEHFRHYGFKRERYLFSLKDDDTLVAVFMVCISELGMNMSELTNCMHVFVLEPDRLPSKILNSSLYRLSSHYEHDNLPVLIFPKEYAETQAIPFDKTYNFWVLDVDKSSDEYFSHVEKILHRAKKK